MALTTDDNGNERFDVAKVVILSGWSLSLLTCFAVIAAAIFLAVTGKPIDGPLKEWSGMCLGFLLATFVPLVKDFIAK